jgi:hypothetical protein
MGWGEWRRERRSIRNAGRAFSLESPDFVICDLQLFRLVWKHDDLHEHELFAGFDCSNVEREHDYIREELLILT